MTDFNPSIFANLGEVRYRDPKAHEADPRGVKQGYANGITKREYFAGLALANLGPIENFKSAAVNAVKLADAIIAELEK